MHCWPVESSLDWREPTFERPKDRGDQRRSMAELCRRTRQRDMRDAVKKSCRRIRRQPSGSDPRPIKDPQAISLSFQQILLTASAVSPSWCGRPHCRSASVYFPWIGDEYEGRYPTHRCLSYSRRRNDCIRVATAARPAVNEPIQRLRHMRAQAGIGCLTIGHRNSGPPSGLS